MLMTEVEIFVECSIAKLSLTFLIALLRSVPDFFRYARDLFRCEPDLFRDESDFFRCESDLFRDQRDFFRCESCLSFFIVCSK